MKSSLLSRLNDAEVAAFCCCAADAPGWQREVEDFLRASALRSTEHVVGLRDDEDRLVGVSCFDPVTITELPLPNPVKVRGWSLLVMGVAVDHQGNGHAKTLLRETLGRMKQIDETRTVLRARAHADNAVSLRLLISDRLIKADVGER